MLKRDGEKIEPIDANNQDDKYEQNKSERLWREKSYDSRSVISLEEFEIDAEHSIKVKHQY